MMNTKFKIKEQNGIYGIEIYRNVSDTNDTYTYIDTFSPMNLTEINELKQFLKDFLWQKFNEGE